MDLKKTGTLIMLHEGYRRYPYLDTKGNVTIGIGNNLSAKGITMDEAKSLYPDGISMEDATIDMNKLINSINQKLLFNIPFYKDLDDVRQAVLIDMSYNMGISKLFTFTKMLKNIKDKDYEAAYSSLLDSLAAHQLPKRYKELADMMASGKW